MAAINLDDFLKDRFHEQWRDSQRWLIEHQEPRPAHQRATNRQHLLLPPGERSRDLAHALLQPWKNAERVLHLTPDCILIPKQVGAHLQILKHG